MTKATVRAALHRIAATADSAAAVPGLDVAVAFVFGQIAREARGAIADDPALLEAARLHGRSSIARASPLILGPELSASHPDSSRAFYRSCATGAYKVPCGALTESDFRKAAVAGGFTAPFSDLQESPVVRTAWWSWSDSNQPPECYGMRGCPTSSPCRTPGTRARRGPLLMGISATGKSSVAVTPAWKVPVFLGPRQPSSPGRHHHWALTIRSAFRSC